MSSAPDGTNPGSSPLARGTLSRGLKRVEAGAQGPHKLARGYLPVPTYSNHWVADEGLRDAVARYLVHETRQVDAERAVLETHGPFRREPDAPG